MVKRPPADVFLGAEALSFLGSFRVGLALLQVRTILRAIAHGRSDKRSTPTPFANQPPSVVKRVLRIGWAVEAVARNAPVAFVCFPQTLAGYSMLRLRGIPATMIYGVARSQEGTLISHAWLTVGDRTVLGGDGSDGFSPIEQWS
jgi:hypothetical protein